MIVVGRPVGPVPQAASGQRDRSVDSARDQAGPTTYPAEHARSGMAVTASLVRHDFPPSQPSTDSGGWVTRA